MVSTGKLDFGKLGILVEKPLVFLSLFGMWVFCILSAAGCRWVLLLRGAGYVMQWSRGILLQAIGLFFNTAMPGAVGGDIVKVTYVIRENPHQGKTPAMATILLDRILGMYGLFTIGLVVAALHFERFLDNPRLPGMGFLILAVMAGITLFLCAVFVPYKQRDPIETMLSSGFPGLSILKKIYLAFRQYHYTKRYLLAGWLLSIFLQFMSMLVFTYLTISITGQDVRLIDMALVFPIGILTTALPISPGGLGVGHAAFEELFVMVGLRGGADVFNVYILAQFAFNMLGALPYMIFRQNIPDLENSPNEEAAPG